MQFFNSKEEVLDIQLTPYGKMLYSQGKFDPKSYSFSDEGVVYNGSIAGFSEEQNNTNVRIQEETPYIKTITRKTHCRQEQIDVDNSKIKNKETSIIESELAKTYALGNIKTNSQLSPKIKIYVFEGEIAATSNLLTSSVASLPTFSKQAPLNIPQIDVNMTYKTSVVDSRSPENVFNLDDRANASNKREVYTSPDEGDISRTIRSEPFKDGGQIIVLPERIFVLIEEENTVNSFDNYEMEVYEIMDSVNPETGNNELRQLKFMKTIEDYELQNNVLPEKEKTQSIEKTISSFMITRLSNRFHRNEQRSTVAENINLDPAEGILKDEVEYYFSLSTDYDQTISEVSVCEYVRMLRARGFKLDMPINCPEESTSSKQVFGTDVYASSIINPQKC